MAEREIKTKLTLDGEKEFKRQISSINQELRLGNAQLKEVAATYDLNGNAQEKLTAKSRILREQLDAQNRIVQEYESRMRQAESATNLSADGLRNYTMQLTNARTKAKQLEKELNDTDRELEELGRDSRRAGDQLERNLGEGAEEVEDKFERMARGIKESLEDVRGLQSISLGVDLVRGAWDIGENIANFVEQTVNENLKRSMVGYNITSAGGNLAASMGLANEYAAIFQDRESAYEAVSNIVAAGYNDADLRRMAQYIGGAAIRFQDTLKIESLADSLQETLSKGQLTGQIGELVSRLEAQTGISEEMVNLQLAEARKQDEKSGGNAQTMLALEAYLKNAGLAEYYEGFKGQNKELVDAATNLQEFNDALNELTQTTLPLLTPAIEGLTSVIKYVTGLVETPEKIIEDIENALPDPTPSNKGVKVQKSKLEQWGAIIAQGATGGSQWYDMTNEMYGVGLQAIINQSMKTSISTRTEKGAVGARFGIAEAVNGETEEAKSKLQELAVAAVAVGAETGAGLISGLDSATARLRAVAEAQRLTLEDVWAEPITPTVVVGYRTAGPVNQTVPEVNVNVNPAPVVLDDRVVTKVMFDRINTEMANQINK